MENKLLKMIGTVIVLLLSSCSSISIPTLVPGTQPAAHPSGPHQVSLWDGSTEAIWEKLQHTSSAHLVAMQTNGPLQTAWIELALISKRSSLNTSQLVRDLMAWRAQNPAHPANQLLPDNATLDQLLSVTPPTKIALLLPQSGPYTSSGQMIREGFLNSYYAGLTKNSQQSVKFYDTSQGNMAALYQQAVSEGADFIVGPLLKENVQQLITTASLSKTTLALNYTDGSLPANFYEFGLLPEDEAATIADKARQAGLSRAIIIAPQSTWGNRIVASFLARWRTIGGSVTGSLYFSSPNNLNQDIAHLLNVDPAQAKNNGPVQPQGRHDFDVIFLFAQPQTARAIVPLLKYYYINHVPIYATSAVYSGSPNPAKDVDLDDVIICDIPWHKNQGDNRLYAVGQDAYLLSQALPRLINLPNFSLYGKTGALTISAKHQVHRSLPCTAIHNGLL